MITAQTHRIWGRTEPIAKAYLCETLLGWLSFSHVHSFCNCNLKHLVFFSTLSCFVFAISGGISSLFVSLKLSLTAFSFSIVGFQNIGGAKLLAMAGGLVVGLQGVLHLSPTSEEDCTSNKPTRRPENRLECYAVLSFSLREILLQFHGAAGEGHM
jgi:hypothetical protein